MNSSLFDETRSERAKELTILHRRPENRGKIFVADLEEVESLPRHAVLAHLDAVDACVCINYLEHIIGQLGEQGSEFHEKLIELYLGSARSAEKR